MTEPAAWRLVGDHQHNPTHPVMVRRYPDLAEPATFVDCWQCRTTWELGRPTSAAWAQLAPGRTDWRAYSEPGWCQGCSKQRDRVHAGLCHDCALHYGYLTPLGHALVLPTDDPDAELVAGLQRMLAEPVPPGQPGPEWPQAGPPPAEPPDQPEPERSLVVPYVVCQSQGGPYQDASFVAGAQSAYLHAQLQARDRDQVATWVYPELVPLVDLLAMECGYSMVAEPWADYPDQWVLVTCTRHPAP